MARQQAFLEGVFRNNRSFSKKSSSSIKKPQQKMLFEALEPRVLLSNDTMVFAADLLHSDLTVKIDDGVAKIIDSNTGNLLLSSALENTSAISIQGSEGDDSLRIDSSVASSGVAVSFDGGAGTDALYGPGVDSTWNVTGDGVGSIGNLTFAELEELYGAADNEDTFVIQQDGSIDLVDGGDRGFDSLDFEGVYGTGVSRATGPSSGTIQLDNIFVRYEGLEPVDLGSVEDLVIDLDPLAGPAADIVELRLVSGNEYILDSVNGAFEDQTFDEFAGGTVTIK